MRGRRRQRKKNLKREIREHWDELAYAFAHPELYLDWPRLTVDGPPVGRSVDTFIWDDPIMSGRGIE